MKIESGKNPADQKQDNHLQDMRRLVLRSNMKKIINYFIRRKKILALQKKLIKTQIRFIRFMEAKVRTIESEKETAINISSKGIEPYLEEIIWEILSDIQLRANTEQSEFLLSKLPVFKRQFQNPILIAIDRIKNFFSRR